MFLVIHKRLFFLLKSNDLYQPYVFIFPFLFVLLSPQKVSFLFSQFKISQIPAAGAVSCSEGSRRRPLKHKKWAEEVGEEDKALKEKQQEELKVNTLHPLPQTELRNLAKNKLFLVPEAMATIDSIPL